MNDKIKTWEPVNFELELNSLWSFPNRGKWATHDAKYRGNFSPFIPRNVILRYSKEGDTILDQFAGSGTTLIEAKLMNRNAIGVDINKNALKTCALKTSFIREKSGKVKLKLADARQLTFIKDNSINLVCTHPPYADIIKYSDGIKGDLSHLDHESFLYEMKKVAQECYRVLKPNSYCAIVMGDIRKNGHVIPLGFRTLNVFEKVGFKLKEIVIKEQHNCKTTGFWKNNSLKYNFLLLKHEYLFILKS